MTDNFDYESVVPAAQAGDEEAFNQLHHQIHPYIQTCIRNVLKNQDDLLDVEQDTYFKVIKNIKQLKDPNKFKSWVTKIATNTAKEWNAKQGKHDLTEAPYPNMYDEEIQSILDLAVTESGSEYTPDHFDEKDFINYLFETLKEDEQQIVLLSAQGYNQSQIAEKLEIPVGTVKSRKHYAFEKMRKRLTTLEKRDNEQLYAFQENFIWHSILDTQSFGSSVGSKVFSAETVTGTAAGKTGSGVPLAGKIAAIVLSAGIVGGGVAYGVARNQSPQETAFGIRQSASYSTTVVNTTPNDNAASTTRASQTRRNALREIASVTQFRDITNVTSAPSATTTRSIQSETFQYQAGGNDYRNNP